MSSKSQIFSEALKTLLEELDASDDVVTTDESSVVITFGDESTYKLGPQECQKVFQNLNSVEQFIKLVPEPQESSVSIHDSTLPDEVIFELEDWFLVVEEL